MDDFYAARDRTTPPLPWPSIAPPITAALAAQISSHRALAILLLVMSASLTLMLLVPSPLVLFTMMALVGLVSFGLFGLIPAYIAEVLPPQAVGQVYGRANFCLGLGSLSSGWAEGQLHEMTDSLMLHWALMAAVLLLAAMLAAHLPNRVVKGRTFRA